jgi:hypothetical protein
VHQDFRDLHLDALKESIKISSVALSRCVASVVVYFLKKYDGCGVVQTVYIPQDRDCQHVPQLRCVASVVVYFFKKYDGCGVVQTVVNTIALRCVAYGTGPATVIERERK